MKEETPVAVGVPTIVAPLRFIPAGRAPLTMLQVNGAVPFWVLSAAEYE